MLQFFVQYDTIIKVSAGYSLANAFCSEEQNQAQAKLYLILPERTTKKSQSAKHDCRRDRQDF